VQKLCQSTNPLGKCMDFVHEDLAAMAKEHDRWTNE
jgi:TRAF3-interacting protein 1